MTTSRAILACVAGSLALMGLSMATYPGGSWLDRGAQHHDWLRNFLCDLLGPVAINGQPNPIGGPAMIAAMGLFAVALALTWWTIPRLFTGERLGLGVRVFGVVSTVGLVAVPLTPPTVSYQLHAAAVFTGGIPAFAAWLLSVVGLARMPATRRLAALGLWALLLVGVGFGLYAREYFFRGGPTVLLPVSHRVATVFVVGWVVAVAVRAGKPR